MADNGQLQWSPDGRPFLVNEQGQKYFVPPIVAAQYRDDPRAQAWATQQGAHIGTPGGTDTVTGAPGASLFKEHGTWNPDTGKYDQGLNWTNIAAMVIGGFITAGAANALMGANPGTIEAAISSGTAPDGSAIAGGAGALVDPSIDTVAAASGTTAATGALPATQIGTGMIPAVGGSGSGAVSSALSGGGILSKAGMAQDLLQVGGKAIGAATQSAGNTQLTNNELNAQAAQINNNATSNYETERERLSQLEATQRSTDQTNLARASYLQNPRVSPFDPAGAPVQSANYMSGLSAIEQQALARLKTPLTYDPATIAPTKPTPYVPNTTMSTAQKVGNVAAPALTIAGALAPYLRYL